jgi:hypothetical protein
VILIGATVAYDDRERLARLTKTLNPHSKIVSVEPPGSRGLELADKRVTASDENAMLLAVTSLISGDAESDLEEWRR